MVRINWQAIHTNFVAEPANFALLLRTVVTWSANGLQFAENEFHLIASVRLDMIGDACGRNNPSLLA
jgi:hypothetical protein